MWIKDLKNGMRKVMIDAEVISKEEKTWYVLTCNSCKKRKRFEEKPNKCPYCNSADIRIQRASEARIKDKKGGECNLKLWDDNIDRIHIGDKILIKDAMVKKFSYDKDGQNIEGFDLSLGEFHPERKLQIKIEET